MTIDSPTRRPDWSFCLHPKEKERVREPFAKKDWTRAFLLTGLVWISIWLIPISSGWQIAPLFVLNVLGAVGAWARMSRKAAYDLGKLDMRDQVWASMREAMDREMSFISWGLAEIERESVRLGLEPHELFDRMLLEQSMEAKDDLDTGEIDEKWCPWCRDWEPEEKDT